MLVSCVDHVMIMLYITDHWTWVIKERATGIWVFEEKERLTLFTKMNELVCLLFFPLGFLSLNLMLIHLSLCVSDLGLQRDILHQLEGIILEV